MRTARIPLPPFPIAPNTYSQGNEQEFRRAVEQSFQLKPPRETIPQKLSHAQFQPTSNLITWSHGLDYLQPGDVAVSTFLADTGILTGATIVGMRARLYREAVGDSASVQLYRVANNTDASTSIGLTDHTTTGWATIETTLATPEYVDEFAIFAYLTLESTALAQDARFKWVEIDYY